MSVAEFVNALVCASEKAADIARAIRRDDVLLQLLVQEKGEDEKNKRFACDFKTLADVLIQEATKHDIGNQFTEIAESIYGEESNVFTNQMGETVIVQVLNTPQETEALLTAVLGGDQSAAHLLSATVHSDVTLEMDSELQQLKNLDAPLHELAVWIDPIDATAEYIHGDGGGSVLEIDSHLRGLPCVTVLLGVYDKTTGQPVAGVVNQPFYRFFPDTNKWTGRCYWGVSYRGVQASSKSLELSSTQGDPVIVLSGTESSEIQSSLRDENYKLAFASGAGFKQLCVARGQADLYLLTKPSTFYWDTCGPHALLLALGGGIIALDQALAQSGDPDYDKTSLTYTGPPSAGKMDALCHHGGLVAYREKHNLDKLIKILKAVLVKKAAL